MAEEELQAQFMSITGASSNISQQYLRVADQNLNQAIELYFTNDGASLDSGSNVTSQPSAMPATYPSEVLPDEVVSDVIMIDSSDEEEDDPSEPPDSAINIAPTRRGPLGSRRTAAALHTPPTATPPPGQSTTAWLQDDEAVARQLQEELYGGGGQSNSQLGEMMGQDYRAPIQQMTDTLVGSDSFDMGDNVEDAHNAALAQLLTRRQRGQGRGRPGIFNQSSSSIWNSGNGANPSTGILGNGPPTRPIGGVSEASSRANTLAEMYRPPFELMSRIGWESAREEGKTSFKWILINIQDASIFDCQILNRDVWKNAGVVETVKENFIFLQYSKDDERAQPYIQFYFHDKDIDSAYPHIAIVDPRTGEQVKVWSGPPSPKAADFLMQLHEFLDRYSLHVSAKNPVAKRKPELQKKTQLDRMTESQQLEMAMQASLAQPSSSTPVFANATPSDPDDLTRSVDNLDSDQAGSRLRSGPDVHPASLYGTGEADDRAKPDRAEPQEQANEEDSQAAKRSALFHTILPENGASAMTTPTPAETTRIQFRFPTGRVVHRFLLTDNIRALYARLKAELPDPSFDAREFDLIFMGSNLLDSLDTSILEAGLRNATVMVELTGAS